MHITEIKGGDLMNSEKKETLEEFILRWNFTYDSLIFSANKAPVTKRPTNIEARFTTSLYQDLLTDDNWFKLVREIADKSQNLMFVKSDTNYFKLGILEMVVSSQSRDYDDDHIIAALKWIGEKFFPYVSIA